MRDINSIINFIFKTKKGNRTLFLFSFAFIVFCVFVLRGFVQILATEGAGCIYLKIFNIKCLTCGATRATERLINGDIIGAFYYNPLYVIFLGVLGIVYIKFGINAFSSNYKPFKIKFRLWQLICLGAIIIVYSVVRNMPFYKQFFY